MKSTACQAPGWYIFGERENGRASPGTSSRVAFALHNSPRHAQGCIILHFPLERGKSTTVQDMYIGPHTYRQEALDLLVSCGSTTGMQLCTRNGSRTPLPSGAGLLLASIISASHGVV